MLLEAMRDEPSIYHTFTPLSIYRYRFSGGKRCCYLERRTRRVGRQRTARGFHLWRSPCSAVEEEEGTGYLRAFKLFKEIGKAKVRL